MAEPLIDDVTIRAYVAAVVGSVRLPFGKRSSAVVSPDRSATLAQNSTKERVLSVSVTRSDGGATVNVIFSQNTSGGASANDYPFTFSNVSKQVFVLRPGDVLSVTVAAGAPTTPKFAVGQETY